MNYLVFTALFVGFLVSGLIFLFSIKRQPSNWWLLGFLFSLGYCSLIGYLLFSELIFTTPHLIRTGTLFGYLLTPLLFAYSKAILLPGKSWSKWQLLLFLPTFLFAVDLMPFWISSAAEKKAIFQASLSTMKYLHSFSEGWFMPKGFHFVFRAIWNLVWYVVSLGLLYRHWPASSLHVPVSSKRVYWFLVWLHVLCFPFLVLHVSNTFLNNTWYTLGPFTALMAIPLLGIAVYLLFFPDVVYGFSWQPMNDEPKVNQALNPQENKTFSNQKPNQDDSLEEYDVLLTQMITEHQYFLQQGLSIHQLSALSHIPVYIISAICNKRKNLPFNHWINQFRINYFMERCKVEDHQTFTIESLGLQSGFSSKVTFFNAFKRETGTTPGAFIKQLQENEGK